MTKEQYIYFLIENGFNDLQLNFFLYDLFYSADTITEEKIDEIYEAYRVYSLKVDGDINNPYSYLVVFLRDLRMRANHYGSQSYILVVDGTLNPYYLKKYGIPMIRNFLINPSISFFGFLSKLVIDNRVKKDWAYNILCLLNENNIVNKELYNIGDLCYTKIEDNHSKKVRFIDNFDSYRLIKHAEESEQIKNDLQNTKIQGSNINRSDVMFY